MFLGREIDDAVANVVIAQLLFLDAEDPGKDIMLYINSRAHRQRPGGQSERASDRMPNRRFVRCSKCDQ